MKASGALLLASMLLAACQSDESPGQPGEQVRGFEPPVASNPEPPVEYPVELFERRVEGVALLRLFVTEAGTIVPESTRIEESSGYPALDSAAIQSVSLLRFAPARRDGSPVATAFIQPIHFRHPDLAAAGENQ